VIAWPEPRHASGRDGAIRALRIQTITAPSAFAPPRPERASDDLSLVTSLLIRQYIARNIATFPGAP
jgi:hypothetical protein